MSADHDQQRPLAREYLEALAIAVIFAVFARTYVVQAFKIPSGSMEPNLLVGDHILVNKFIYGPTLFSLERSLLPVRDVRRGDVVVFRFPPDPSRDFVKRAIGLPGDTIRLADKKLHINGRRVADESYAIHSDKTAYPHGPLFGATPTGQLRDNFGPFLVPPANYFCLGDNRDNSHDSRFWGTVPESLVKGRALMVYWSFASPAADFGEGSGFWNKLERAARVALHSFSRTRWDRSFRIVR
ncbi:MAG TPA: signal peptidase I [Thermoanaerobaculia bacterium]|nr:signal peptidase I [Thermoanaerobaculia bacterium]